MTFFLLLLSLRLRRFEATVLFTRLDGILCRRIKQPPLGNYVSTIFDNRERRKVFAICRFIASNCYCFINANLRLDTSTICGWAMGNSSTCLKFFAMKKDTHLELSFRFNRRYSSWSDSDSASSSKVDSASERAESGT